MNTITVGSRVHTAMKLQFTDRDPIVINGASDPGAVDGVGITKDVDAEAFHAWMQDHADHAPVEAGLIFEVPADADPSPHATVPPVDEPVPTAATEEPPHVDEHPAE